MTKAIGFSAFGGADVLHPIEIDLPAPGPGQVRVAVRTAGVNPVDHKLRSGAMAELFPVTFPHVTGYELAGVVEAVGAGVTRWAPGDEVLGPTDGGGGYAEHALLDAGKVVRKPAALGWEQAAAIPVAAETAWRSLALLDVERGGTLLVHGAAGGVGTVLLQFARSRGIRVIGTASESNHARLRALGAIPVTYGDGLAERVRAVAPDGVDRVLDAAGQGDVLPLSIELVGGAGRVLTIADWAGAAEHGVRFSGGSETVHHHGPALAAALALYEEGTLDLPLHEVFPLAEAAQAHRVSEAGHVRGKIVLAVG
ncbi:NADP-dependent oxidoreductase [Kitasatospora sp. NPDC003701]